MWALYPHEERGTIAAAQDLIYELGGLHGLVGADRRDLDLPGIGPARRAVLNEKKCVGHFVLDRYCILKVSTSPCARFAGSSTL